MNPILPIAGGLGLLLLLSSSSKASAATSKPAPSQTLPRPPGKTAIDFQGRIVEAVGRSDWDGVLAIANDMQAAGLVDEAQALRTWAISMKSISVPTGARSPGQPVLAPSPALPNPPFVVPPFVAPSSVPLPAGVPVSSAQTQRLQVAQAMAVDLRNSTRYKENPVLVKRFQEQEGLVSDGKYGPKSALALAELGIIPPRPRYWARKTVQVDKKQYAAEMMARAATDTPRQADWTAASKVQNDPVA